MTDSLGLLASVAVFCGSSNGVDQHYLDLAGELGAVLAAEGITMVYGGGNSGLMGAVADGTMRAGGEVTGVIPGGLFTNGIDGDHVTSLEVVDDMHERKARMYELSDGFIGLPGGLGTFEEVFEAATWTQLGLHAGKRDKTVVLLDRDGFWDPVHQILDRANRDGFVRDANRAIIRRASTIDEALAILRELPSRVAPEYVA